jgi:hypothetical protein
MKTTYVEMSKKLTVSDAEFSGGSDSERIYMKDSKRIMEHLERKGVVHLPGTFAYIAIFTCGTIGSLHRHFDFSSLQAHLLARGHSLLPRIG